MLGRYILLGVMFAAALVLLWLCLGELYRAIRLADRILAARSESGKPVSIFGDRTQPMRHVSLAGKRKGA